MKKIALIGILVLGVLGSIWIMGKKEAEPAQNDKLSVTTSFYPLYFFASEIGGDKISVTSITPSGTEPHDYEPTPQDIVTIGKSQLLVLNGNGFEPWGEKIKATIDPQKTMVLSAGEGLTGKADPHFWLSPSLAIELAAEIESALETIDPENALYYRANAVALEEKLAALDAEYKSGLSTCREKNIITSHDAFGYLAEAYGLTQVPIAGLSPDAEPTPQEIASIAKFAKDNTIKYIFFESLVSPKLAQTIASEVGAKTLVLNPLESVGPGEDYFSEMQANLKNLRIALQCRKQ